MIKRESFLRIVSVCSFFCREHQVDGLVSVHSVRFHDEANFKATLLYRSLRLLCASEAECEGKRGDGRG